MPTGRASIPWDRDSASMQYRADSLGLVGHVTTLLMDLIHEQLFNIDHSFYGTRGNRNTIMVE